MSEMYNLIHDNGENRLYDSWELIKAYRLYDHDRHDLKPEGREYEMIDIIPWEGKLVSFNMIK